MSHPPTAAEPDWLGRDEQDSWIAIVGLCLLLPTALDAQLQRDSRLGLFEYLVLSRLSMAPDRTLRMSELATLANGSLSRLSNVVKRIERRGWVEREPDPADGRFTLAVLTPDGYEQVVAAAPGHVAAVRELIFDALRDDQVGPLTDALSAILERVSSEPRGGGQGGGCGPG